MSIPNGLRGAGLALATLIALTGSADVAAGAATVPSTPTTLPPALVTLEQKMGELQVSSERFSLKTAITGVKLPRGLTKLLSLDSTDSGEITTSPPAGNLNLSLFGQPLTFRVVNETTYLYEPALSRYDGGRPWIKFGRHGFGELISPPAAVTPEPMHTKASEPPFAGEIKLINSATDVREGGASTVDGQAVTQFTGGLDLSKIEKPLRSITIKTAHGRRVIHPRRIKRTARLELFIAPTGLPVRTVVATTTGKATATVTLDIPAINFPLVIEAPPASQTIGLAELRKLEKKLAKRHRRHTRKSKSVRVKVGG